MLIYLAIPAAIVAAIYIYLTWNYSHWKKRGIKGPKPHFLYGNFQSSIRQKRNMAYDHLDIYKQFKGKERFVGVYVSRSPQLMLLDPDLIKDVMVTNFKNFHDNDFAKWFNLDPIFTRNPFFLTGDAWKQKRAEITPALSSTKLKVMYPVMQTVSKMMTKYIEEENVKKTFKQGGFDGKELSQRFTTENMSNCLYGVEAGAFTNDCPIRTQISLMVESFMKSINHHFMATVFPIINLFSSAPLMPVSIQKFFVKLTEDAIQLRKASGSSRFDILNFLIETQEKKTLSDIDVVAHAITFLIDGTETSGGVLSSCLNMLARNPEVQKKLRDEINTAFSEHGSLSFEAVSDLPYLDQVLHETLRFFPPATFLTRICTEPCEIEDFKDKKYQLKYGDVMVIPAHALHHDEQYYEDPEKFNPDRFDPAVGGIKKFKEMGVFLPFGDGPRQCLGMRLALTQMKTALVELVRTFEIRLNPKSQKEIVISAASFLLEPEGGVWLDFVRI